MSFEDYSALFSGTFGIVGLIVLVLIVAGLWRIFTKAGRPGWASLIPIYNGIVLLQISGLSGWYFILLIIPIINIIMFFVLCMRLSQSFGHGFPYAILLFFLYPLMILILGFGGDKYLGPSYG